MSQKVIDAGKISNVDIHNMLKRAANEVKDWTKPSKGNKGISRGSNWNIFCKDFDINKQYSAIHKYRIIQEFGEFLDDNLKTTKKAKPKSKTPTHFAPDLSKFK
jgi:hypothetical protein